MFPMIFILLVAMPILEIFVLIQVGSVIGAWTTIGIVIITAILGSWMLRSQGISTMNKARSRLADGEIPAFQIFEGLALGVGGALLLTPGFITDALGFLCLLPPTRTMLIKLLTKKVSVSGMGVNVGAGSGQHSNAGFKQAQKKSVDGDVIEGEFTRDD